MNPKVSFGHDFLYVMRSLQLSASPKSIDPIADAATRLFLVMWGLTAEEADEANNLFFQHVDQDRSGDFRACFERLAGHVRKDRVASERLVIQAAAIASIDLKVTSEETMFIRALEGYLDLKPSEFDALLKQGANWAVGLHFFGNTYRVSKKD